MDIEIEAKLKVDSPDVVAERLSQLGAEFVEEQVQIDSYFDDANRSMTTGDKCLRLRQEQAGDNERVYLTYKGAREKGQFKRRPEVEVELKDWQSAEGLLSALGFEKVLGFEKARRLWHIGGCSVSLDKLELLGEFMEIEGPNEEKIAVVQKSLGLENVAHIPQSYATLMAEKLGREGVGKQ
jgi:adenylate cyclase class 2